MTINEIITEHVVNKIGERLYWSFTSIDVITLWSFTAIDAITLNDIYTLLNFYYDDEICQMVKSNMSIIQKIMEKVKELSILYAKSR